jgi:hypothetical protein
MKAIWKLAGIPSAQTDVFNIGRHAPNDRRLKMTRTTILLLAAAATLAAAINTPASALNPQPLPPMPRCSPSPCNSIPTVTSPHLFRH